eukprot:TRINITY_DN10203_c4_g2_i1.p1 TRINITY_DN10203_c4_g2~~TRINITY_DN10203_c4_g2_i1.p1  ORF type:complete len:854 (+),score=319.98 TRINITY_DN10203_c4_g2_i1:118-2679(+)
MLQLRRGAGTAARGRRGFTGRPAPPPPRAGLETFGTADMEERQANLDQVAAEAWPYRRYRHPSIVGGFGAERHTELKWMLEANYGQEEGGRIFNEEVVPRLLHLRRHFSQHLEKGNPYAYGAPKEAAAADPPPPPHAASQNPLESVLQRGAVDLDAISLADLERLLHAVAGGGASGDARQACRQALYYALKGASVWVPMQVIHVATMLAEFGDDIPNEYRAMAEMYAASAGEGDGDLQPTFLPLPGREGDPAAPAFLPIFLSQGACEAFLAGGAAHAPAPGGYKHFSAEVPLAALIRDFDDSPQEVVLGLNHAAPAPAGAGAAPKTPAAFFPDADSGGGGAPPTPTPALWLTAQERGDITRASREVVEAVVAAAAAASPPPPPSGAPPRPVEEPEPEDAAASAAHGELQQLLDGMISYLKCMRSSVRFGYVAAQEVAGEDLIHIGLEMATPDNDHKHPLSAYNLNHNTLSVAAARAAAAAAAASPRNRRKKKPKMTPKRWRRFQMHLADALLKQQPIDDLLGAEEKEKPTLKRMRGRYFAAVRRAKKSMKDAAVARKTIEEREKEAEMLLDYGAVVRGLKEHPAVARLMRESFVSFHDVGAVRVKHAENPSVVSRFDQTTPFYDNDNKYAAIERHFKLGASAEDQKRAELAAVMKQAKQHGHNTYRTLMLLRQQDTADGAATVSFTEDEEVFLSEGEMGALIIGANNSANHRLQSDKLFYDARRRYTYLTKGPRAAGAQFAPPGYTPHRELAIYRDAERGVDHFQAEVDTREDAEQVPDPARTKKRHVYLKESMALADKARQLGLEIRELRDTSDEFHQMNLSDDERHFGPWRGRDRVSRRFGTAGSAWDRKP